MDVDHIDLQKDGHLGSGDFALEMKQSVQSALHAHVFDNCTRLSADHNDCQATPVPAAPSGGSVILTKIQREIEKQNSQTSPGSLVHVEFTVPSGTSEADLQGQLNSLQTLKFGQKTYHITSLKQFAKVGEEDSSDEANDKDPWWISLIVAGGALLLLVVIAYVVRESPSLSPLRDVVVINKTAAVVKINWNAI